MPIYEFTCESGHKFDRFLKLAAYDAPQVCDCGAPASRKVSTPMFSIDATNFEAYESPTTGRWITSKTQRREDMKASGCVDYEPSMKQEMERKKVAEDAALDRKIDSHVEETIYNMPVRKREKLAAELDSGVDVEILSV